jgi:hypothetical protein
MRGSGKNEFNEFWKLVDIFCMYPELIKHFNLMTNKKHDRIEAGKNHRQEKDDLDILGPSQPERDRKIVFGRAVMSNMGGPPKSACMAYSVRHISPEINPDQAQRVGPPFMWNGPGHMIIYKKYDPESKYL